MLSKNNNILISVVIPVYNGAKYIEQCIESVVMQQCNTEIIVIDDASTDNIDETMENVMKKHHIPIIYIKNEQNIGVAETRNKGIMKANGDYVAFLDADDWWEPNKLQLQLELMKNGKRFVFTGRKNIYEGTNQMNVVEIPEKVTEKELLKNNVIACSSVLIETKLIQKHLMKRRGICEDYYTWINVLREEEYAYGINLPLINYRVHKGSGSSNKIKHAVMRYDTYKEVGIDFFHRLYYSISYIFVGLSKYSKKEGNK